MELTAKKPSSFLDKFYEDYEKKMQKKVTFLEEIFIEARDKKSIPIYMTRSRIKSYDSAYLKTKRKHKVNIEEITDLIGIRVLCLFEQNLIDVYNYLLKFLNYYAAELIEVTIYHSEEIFIYEDNFT